MASYIFETITPEQAAAFQPGDSLSFTSGGVALSRVAFGLDSATVGMADRTVTFGPGIFGKVAGLADGGALFVGTPGPDALVGGSASYALFGGPGADAFNGGGLGNLIQGNQGADSLSGGPGSDTIFGGQDNDLINAVAGAGDHNLVNGNRGDDMIFGGNSGDTLLGGQGMDLITGGLGADLLSGNLDNDTINGGGGGDMILGGGGYDIMTGGGGNPVFVFEPGSSVIDFQLSDRILDWTPAYRLQLPVTGGYGEVEATPPAPPAPPMTPVPGGYSYAPVDDFSLAQTAAANAFAGNGALKIVAAQGGSDVDVFVDTNGDHLIDMAIILSNTTLASVSEGNFI